MSKKSLSCCERKMNWYKQLANLKTRSLVVLLKDKTLKLGWAAVNFNLEIVILTNLTQHHPQHRQKTDSRMTSDALFVVVVIILHKICHTCGMTHASAAIHKQKHHRDILERRVLPLRWEKWPKKSYSENFTAITSNTRPQRVILRFKPAVWWMSINRYHGFHTLAKRRFFPPFSSTRRNVLAFKPFLQYFATRSDTASCQDYEEYKFVECL